MAKSNSSATTSKEKASSASNGADAELNGTLGNNGASDSFDAEYSELIEQAKTWVEENQTMAMLGGFGFGVFIGVLLRR